MAFSQSWIVSYNEYHIILARMNSPLKPTTPGTSVLYSKSCKLEA